MSEEILDQKEEGDRLDNMTIAQLRSYAKLINVPLTREHTTEDIKRDIRAKQKKQNIVNEADTSTGPAPGRWRIILHKNTEFGAKAGSRPVTIKVNGYTCTIPRNIPVDVPEKVVRVLENSCHYVAVEQPDGKSWGFEAQLSYPFQVVAMTPGPDPSPGYEVSKARKYMMREAFRNEFGYWPRNSAQLEEAIKEGLIKRAAPAIPETTKE
jgi:hypothetical protein